MSGQRLIIELLMGSASIHTVRDESLQAEYRELADEYTRAVRELFADRLVSICFFGSVVRGEATPESDIDVLVVAKGVPNDVGLRLQETSDIYLELKRSEAYRKLRSLGRNALVSAIVLTPEEAKTHPPIMLDMTEDAFMAYDKDGFLERVLDDIRNRLKELGARKVKGEKGYYWILKPDARPDEVVEI
jgi:hypothetical protein